MSSVKLSTVLSAMSYALDLTEGQPQGHAARSCLIGMRVAGELRLSADERSDLFYALLLKDAGCSSNAARVSQLFGGNDQDAKRGLWERDWRRWRERIAYALESTEPDGTLVERLRRFATLALAGPSSQRELFEILVLARCRETRHLGYDRWGHAADRGRGIMTNALIFIGIILLVVSVVALLDWLARRKDQQSHAPRA